MSRWSLEHIPDARGKRVVITGANSGIGFEAARMLAARGAEVTLACRSAERGQQAVARIREAQPDAAVSLMQLDMASLASIRAFAGAFTRKQGALHLLINNAGLMAIPHALTEDGFEMQLGVNHFGHFALTGLLMPHLLAEGGARVVTVSSFAHRMGRMRWDDLTGERRYRKWDAYGQSKLANLLFALELQRRFEAGGHDARSLSCHPGYANTNLQMVGPQLEGAGFARAMMKLANATVAQSAEQGAVPTLLAALHPDAAGGDFIGPRGGVTNWLGGLGPCATSRHARDAEAGKRLWDLSVELTGADYAALG